MSRSSEHPLVRTTALVGALCVFALAVCAVSPGLHAGLHTSDVAHQPAPVGEVGHVCAVTLFASGVTTLLAFCLLMLGGHRATGLLLRAADKIAAAQPPYRLVPSHAPPAA